MTFEYRFGPPLNTPQSRGGTPPSYRRTVEFGMIVERDVWVTLRDGTRILVDIYRPLDEQPATLLIAGARTANTYPTNSGVFQMPA
jgi:predicted acyl esterase